jgi:glyoxylase-like metal-dependent hydrolase (beta-lactamase superfamily II)
MRKPLFISNLVRRFQILMLLVATAAAVSGCWDGSTAQAAVRPGAQNSPWGIPYPDMPDFVPPQVRATQFAAISSADEPPIDQTKGYRIEGFGGGVYMVTDGSYQAMLVSSSVGLILVDAPPSIGANLLKAANDVAPGAKIQTLIYSHAHIDHIGYAGEILKTNPSMSIVAHDETNKLLVRAQDPARPLPTVTFATQDQDFPVVLGDQTLQLQYPGPNHEPGNIGIYHRGQKVLMLVDIIFPGWTMWRHLADAQDVPGYFSLVQTMTTRWDFDHLIAGHVGRSGTKADVALQLAFMTDLQTAAGQGLATIKPGVTVNPANLNNPWAVYRDYLDQVVNYCVNQVSPKWQPQFEAYDVWIYDQCSTMEQSLRIDGPSIKQ